jgi:transcriptional regulator with XRE-family HTH domain
MGAKRFNSIDDLLADVSESPELNKKAQERISNRQLSKTLFALRCRCNFSQADLAKKIGCSQGRISKIEHSKDDKLTLKDIVDYCKATNNKIEIGFLPQNKNMVERVKYHYFIMKNILDEMYEISKGDEQFSQKVHQFTSEASLNVLHGLAECLSRFKPSAESKEIIQVTNSHSEETVDLECVKTA